ncbi:glycosyltransferase family 1 protein [Cronobacter sakazakii]|nr:glycosyltransferase family 1 protein [Cronobacter sakazakii]
MIKLHAVSKSDFLKTHFHDIQELLDQKVNPDSIHERFYCGGKGVWTFQTLLAMNYYYGDKFECSIGNECISGAINFMHNDTYGSRVKPWKGITVVARADRPPVIGPDYIVEQCPAIKETKRSKFIPNWPQPGIVKHKTFGNIKKVAYLGRPDSLPSEFFEDEIVEQFAAHGIDFKLQFDEWSDYSDVDVCFSFRNSSFNKLMRKPASKLINCWLGNSIMICDEEPSFKALKKSELDYIVAKNAEDLFLAVMRLVKDKDTYLAMQENSMKRAAEFERHKIAERWFNMFQSIWNKKPQTNNFNPFSFIRFCTGKIILPITRKM